MAIEVGQAAPAFTLSDAGGKRVALGDFRGRDVIVYFYPKDETPGCTKEACAFRDAWEDLQRAGVMVLGISADSEASHAKFAARHRLPFILLSDPDRKVMTKYGAYGEKLMYGKTVTGVIRSTVWVGPDGRVRRHWPKVAKAESHPGQVLAALRAAAAGAGPTRPAAGRAGAGR
ncbi:MAG: peroxiredoxin [Candidatus Krumholzibacteriia bacterium]